MASACLDLLEKIWTKYGSTLISFWNQSAGGLSSNVIKWNFESLWWIKMVSCWEICTNNISFSKWGKIYPFLLFLFFSFFSKINCLQFLQDYSYFLSIINENIGYMNHVCTIVDSIRLEDMYVCWCVKFAK